MLPKSDDDAERFFAKVEYHNYGRNWKTIVAVLIDGKPYDNHNYDRTKLYWMGNNYRRRITNASTQE